MLGLEREYSGYGACLAHDSTSGPPSTAVSISMCRARSKPSALLGVVQNANKKTKMMHVQALHMAVFVEKHLG